MLRAMLAGADGNEAIDDRDGTRTRGRHHALGIEIESVLWRFADDHRERIAAWLARRAAMAHPRLMPVLQHGMLEGGCWASVAATTPWHDAGQGWRSAVRALGDIAAGLAALHDAGLAHGDGFDGAWCEIDGGVRLALPSCAPAVDADARSDVVALARVARALLHAVDDDWFLPTPVRALLRDAEHGRIADGAAAAQACARALAESSTLAAPRRLVISAMPADGGASVWSETDDGEHGAMTVPAAMLRQLDGAWNALRAEPAASVVPSDRAAALAARLVATTLPPAIAARLCLSGWRIDVGDAGTGLPWRLLVGAAMAGRADIRLTFGDGEAEDIGPVEVVAVIAAGEGALARAAAACARRRWWQRVLPAWRRGSVPARGPLLLVGDLDAARGALALMPSLCDRIAIAVLRGAGDALTLRPAAGQILLDPSAPEALQPAVARACLRALAGGAPVHVAAREGDRVLGRRASDHARVGHGARVHGNGDARVAPPARPALVRV